MKRYIQFFKEDTNGNLHEALASDGYKVIDGRLSIQTILSDEKYLKNFRNYTIFEIRKGDFNHYTVEYSNKRVRTIKYSDITKAWSKACYYYSNFNKWAKETYKLSNRQLILLKEDENYSIVR